MGSAPDLGTPYKDLDRLTIEEKVAIHEAISAIVARDDLSTIEMQDEIRAMLEQKLATSSPELADPDPGPPRAS